jgi:transcriptional regulator with XRE-family HTH domain
LKEIRQDKGLTLREVAKSIGISASLLSQVENGKSQPSVGTLYGLVTFYEVSMDAVIAGRETSSSPPPPATAAQPTETLYFHHGASVQRAQDNPTVVMENGVTWERLAVASSDRSVQPLLVTYAPGASSSLQGRWTRHLGVEYAYMLSGVLTLHLEFDVHEVAAGDSIAFSSTRPHFYSNDTDHDARAVFFVHSGEGDPALPEAGPAEAEGMAGLLANLGLSAPVRSD